MIWEDIDAYTRRAKVFGGWIVINVEPVYHSTPNGMQDGWDWRTAMCYVPDLNHEWELEELKNL